jgi:hypothetical protein
MSFMHFMAGGWGVGGGGRVFFCLRVMNDTEGRRRKFRTFADRGSSHRRQSAS